MAAFGFSINSLTLCGLVLAIGLVVDDAIIVVENVEKFLERGLRPLAATRAAMAEITAPIVTITLVLAAVFVPVAFIPGLTGRLYNQFAMTIVFSFVFSAINSLTFSPAMSRLFLKAEARRDEVLPLPLVQRRDAVAGELVRRVPRVHRPPLVDDRHPVARPAGPDGWMLDQRPKSFIPTEDQGYLIVVIQTPDGTSREATSQVVKRGRGDRRWSSPGVEHIVDARRPERPQLHEPEQLAASSSCPLKEWSERKTPGAAGRRPVAGSSRASSSPRSATPSSWSSSRRRSAA